MTKLATVPQGYQAVTPWVIVDGVPAFIDFLVEVFDAQETIRMLADDGVRVGVNPFYQTTIEACRYDAL